MKIFLASTIRYLGLFAACVAFASSLKAAEPKKYEFIAEQSVSIKSLDFQEVRLFLVEAKKYSELFELETLKARAEVLQTIDRESVGEEGIKNESIVAVRKLHNLRYRALLALQGSFIAQWKSKIDKIETELRRRPEQSSKTLRAVNEVTARFKFHNVMLLQFIVLLDKISSQDDVWEERQVQMDAEIERYTRGFDQTKEKYSRVTNGIIDYYFSALREDFITGFKGPTEESVWEQYTASFDKIIYLKRRSEEYKRAPNLEERRIALAKYEALSSATDANLKRFQDRAFYHAFIKTVFRAGVEYTASHTMAFLSVAALVPKASLLIETALMGAGTGLGTGAFSYLDEKVDGAVNGRKFSVEHVLTDVKMGIFIGLASPVTAVGRSYVEKLVFKWAEAGKTPLTLSPAILARTSGALTQTSLLGSLNGFRASFPHLMRGDLRSAMTVGAHTFFWTSVFDRSFAGIRALGEEIATAPFATLPSPTVHVPKIQVPKIQLSKGFRIDVGSSPSFRTHFSLRPQRPNTGNDLDVGFPNGEWRGLNFAPNGNASAFESSVKNSTNLDAAAIEMKVAAPAEVGFSTLKILPVARTQNTLTISPLASPEIETKIFINRPETKKFEVGIPSASQFQKKIQLNTVRPRKTTGEKFTENEFGNEKAAKDQPNHFQAGFARPRFREVKDLLLPYGLGLPKTKKLGTFLWEQAYWDSLHTSRLANLAREIVQNGELSTATSSLEIFETLNGLGGNYNPNDVDELIALYKNLLDVYGQFGAAAFENILQLKTGDGQKFSEALQKKHSFFVFSSQSRQQIRGSVTKALGQVHSSPRLSSAKRVSRRVRSSPNVQNMKSCKKINAGKGKPHPGFQPVVLASALGECFDFAQEWFENIHPELLNTVEKPPAIDVQDAIFEMLELNIPEHLDPILKLWPLCEKILSLSAGNGHVYLVAFLMSIKIEDDSSLTRSLNFQLHYLENLNLQLDGAVDLENLIPANVVSYSPLLKSLVQNWIADGTWSVRVAKKGEMEPSSAMEIDRESRVIRVGRFAIPNFPVYAISEELLHREALLLANLHHEVVDDFLRASILERTRAGEIETLLSQANINIHGPDPEDPSTPRVELKDGETWDIKTIDREAQGLNIHYRALLASVPADQVADAFHYLMELDANYRLLDIYDDLSRRDPALEILEIDGLLKRTNPRLAVEVEVYERLQERLNIERIVGLSQRLTLEEILLGLTEDWENTVRNTHQTVFANPQHLNFSFFALGRQTRNSSEPPSAYGADKVSALALEKLLEKTLEAEKIPLSFQSDFHNFFNYGYMHIIRNDNVGDNLSVLLRKQVETATDISSLLKVIESLPNLDDIRQFFLGTIAHSYTRTLIGLPLRDAWIGGNLNTLQCQEVEECALSNIYERRRDSGFELRRRVSDYRKYLDTLEKALQTIVERSNLEVNSAVIRRRTRLQTSRIVQLETELSKLIGNMRCDSHSRAHAALTDRGSDPWVRDFRDLLLDFEEEPLN